MQGLILVAIVLMNGFFSLSEAALVAARRVRLQHMFDEGRKGAAQALALAEAPSKFLNALQICLLILGIAAGVHGGVTFASSIENWVHLRVPELNEWSRVFGLAGVVIFETFLMVFIGVLVPKRLALLAPESIAVRVAPVIQRLGNMLTPFAISLGRLTDHALIRLPFVKLGRKDSAALTDELKMIVEQGAVEGLIDHNEETMLRRVLQFGDLRGTDLMTPRTRIVGIDLDGPASIAMDIMLTSKHSYFPAYRTSMDNLIGILSFKKVFEEFYRRGHVDLNHCMSEPLYLPDSAGADRIMEAMKKKGTHIAFLIDEFGGLCGVITATDIITAVMGDVPQDSGTVSEKIVVRSDGSLLIDGRSLLSELKDRLGLNLDLIQDESVQTLSGLFMLMSGDVPREGQSITHQGWRFEVIDMDGNRIDKILASVIKDESQNS